MQKGIIDVPLCMLDITLRVALRSGTSRGVKCIYTPRNQGNVSFWHPQRPASYCWIVTLLSL